MQMIFVTRDCEESAVPGKPREFYRANVLGSKANATGSTLDEVVGKLIIDNPKVFREEIIVKVF